MRPIETKLLTFKELLLMALFGCKKHDWSWPTEQKNLNYPAPYDSQRKCTDCGATRLYNVESMEMGPFFIATDDPLHMANEKMGTK